MFFFWGGACLQGSSMKSALIHFAAASALRGPWFRVFRV